MVVLKIARTKGLARSFALQVVVEEFHRFYVLFYRCCQVVAVDLRVESVS